LLLNCFCYELLIVSSVRRDGAAATKVARPLESRVETAAQAPTGFADFVSDDFPALHSSASGLGFFRGPPRNDEML
jgi:hypothetical protein